ncbi:MAG: hypothetical protein A3G34_07555 [Candidatus Lindowbacteria bacterium RIFCSPLOWO2_12_FULL_62_27]|nr:MAG: hypothetical protein A3G34_07555 [Candidatus Lindowbacteria bacterium RIFCSPLOWO2_12_FULL_62_27]
MRGAWGWAFIAALLLGSATAIPASAAMPALAASSDELFSSALKAYVAEKYEESYLYLEQTLKQNPKHERAKKLMEEVTTELRRQGKLVESAPTAAPVAAPAAAPAPAPAATPAAEPVVTPVAKPAPAPVEVIMEDIIIAVPEEKPKPKPAAKEKPKPAPAKKPVKAAAKKEEPKPAPAPAQAAPKEEVKAVTAGESPAAAPTPAPVVAPAETAKAPEPPKEEKPVAVAPPTEAAPATPTTAAAPAAPAAPKETSGTPVLRFGSEKPPAGDEPSVYGLEVYGEPGAPVVFIRTTDGVDFLPNPVASPPMMSIDLPGAVDRLPRKSYDIKRGPILRIRHSQFSTFPIMTARVVLDLLRGSDQPAVEAGRGGIWVRFGGASPPEALAGAPPAAPAVTEPAAAPTPTVEIGPLYAFTNLIGAGQSVAVSRKAAPVGVKVVDAASAQPVIDLPVTFELMSGEGSLSGSAADGVQKIKVNTNKSGVAEAPLAVGRKIEPISIKVSAGDPAKFNLVEMVIPVIVTAGPPVHLEKVSGDGQEAIAGDELKDHLVTRVTDEYGNPVIGAKVQYTILKGNGRLDTIKFNDPRDNEAVSDTAGLARCEVWVLGVEAGEQLVEASLIGGAGTSERVLFTAKSGQRIVSLDFKDAVVVDVIRTLAQLGNMNVIFDLEYDDAKKKFVVPFLDHKGAEKKVEIPPLTIHVVDVTVLEALDMVLESSGLTRVTEGNTVRIIAKTRAVGRPLPVVSDTPQTGGKFVTHVFELKYTTAENIVKLLTEFVEKDGGQIVADPLSNRLLVIQTADNVKKVANILAVLDVSTAKTQESYLEVRTYQLKNASASEMASRLSDILKQSGKFEFTVINSDLSITKLGVISYDQLRLTRRVRGKSGEGITDEQFVKQSLLLNIMTVNPAKNTVTILSTREVLFLMGQVIESLDVKTAYSDTVTREFRFFYLDTETADALIHKHLSVGGTYRHYPEFNSYLVNDRRDVVLELENAVNALDKGAKKLAIYRLKFLDPTNLTSFLGNIIPSPPAAAQEERKRVTATNTGTGEWVWEESVTAAATKEISRGWWLVDKDNKLVIVYDAPAIVENVLRLLEQADNTKTFIRAYEVKNMRVADAAEVLRQFLGLRDARTGAQRFFTTQIFEGTRSTATTSQAISFFRSLTDALDQPAILPLDRANSLLVLAREDVQSAVAAVLPQIDIQMTPGLEIQILDITPLRSYLVIPPQTVTAKTNQSGDAVWTFSTPGSEQLVFRTEIAELVKTMLSPSGMIFITLAQDRLYLIIRDMPPNIEAFKDFVGKMKSYRDLEFKLYKIQNTSAVAIANALAGFVTSSDQAGLTPGKIYGIINLIQSTNTVIVQAPKESIEQIERLIQEMDQPGVGTTPGFTTKVYQMKNVTAADAAVLLSSLFTGSMVSAGGISSGIVGVVRSLAGPNLVIVATLESNIPMVNGMVANIDIATPAPPDFISRSFVLRYIKPSEMANILKGKSKVTEVTVKSSTGKGAAGAAGEITTSAQEGNFDPLVTTSKPASTQSQLFASITADDRLNILTVLAPPAQMNEIHKIIDAHDRPAPQVLIDATILEYTLDDNDQRGINFITNPDALRASGGAQKSVFDPSQLTGKEGKLGMEFSPSLLGAGTYRAILNTAQARVLFEFLTSTNRTEILATPKVTTLNNQKAKILLGQTVRVRLDQTSVTGVVSSATEPVDATLSLEITPTISSERTVELDIVVTINEFSATPVAGTVLTIDRREASSKILLGDAQTLVLGGVIRDKKTLSNSGVPFLKEIPVVGNLFKSKTEKKLKTELMIFISPHVITNLPEATQVTKEVAKSLQQITPFPVNINTSSIAEISELPGLRSDVDPDQPFRLAQRIVARREQFGPYQALEHLMTVPGLTRVIFDDVVYRIEYKVDPNVVSLQELVRIKGINLGMAQKIVEERKARGIFRSEEEFEALMLGLGMNKGLYQRFIKPVIIIRGTGLGDLTLAPPQEQKLPPLPYVPSEPARTAPAPAPAPAPTPAPPVVVPKVAPTRPRSLAPPPQPEQRPATAPAPAPATTAPMTAAPAPQPKPVAPAPQPKPAPLAAPAPQQKQPTAPPPPPPPPPPAAAEPEPEPAPTPKEEPYDASLPPPEIKSSTPPQQASPEQQGKMDINTASLEDLQKLPGIDEYRAKMIDAYRYTYGKFKTISDLKQVPDITDEIFEQVKDKIYVSR